MSLGLQAQTGRYALSFDGIDDYVGFGTTPSYEDIITIEAWIKTTQTGIEHNILSWGNSSSTIGDNIQLRIDDGKLTFGMRDFGDGYDNGWVAITSNQHINTGIWMHIAVVKDGTGVQLYINGVADNSGTINKTMNTDRFILGHFYEVGMVDVDMAFDGEMDEVRIWHSARSAWEIREYMYKDAGSEMEAYYKMSDGSGTTLTDNSKNSHSGSLQNDATWAASDCFVSNGNALHFDGINNHVFFDVGQPAYQSPISIEAWIKSSSAAKEKEIVCWGNNTIVRDVVEFRMDEGLLEFGLYTGSDNKWISVKSTTLINTGNWTHVALVKNGTSVKLYINGFLDASATLDKNPSVTNMQIGVLFQANEQNLAYDFDGEIDEVRIWSIARTEEQIREHMYENLNGNWGGLTAYYRMNQSVSDVGTLYDATTNAYDGSMNYFESDSVFISFQYVHQWLGYEDADWSRAANWNTGTLPSTNSHVNIETDPINSTTLSGAASIYNLYIDSSATLQLDTDAQLSISGLLYKETVSNQVVLKSSPSGTASLIVETEIEGELTAERYLSKDIWHYVSDPVHTTGNFDALNLDLNSGANNDQFYRWEEDYLWDGSTGIWVDILNGEDGSGNNSLLDDEGFETAKGYGFTYKDVDKTLSLSGTPLIDDQSIIITKTPASSHTGANLVGNPFCCDIAINNDADASNNFLFDNNSVLDASYRSVYVWQESEEWDGISNTDYVPLNNSSGATFLEAGQGFMVMAAAHNTSLQFNKAIRKHGSGNFYKSNNPFKRLKIWIRTNSKAAFTEFAFRSDMTAGLDPSYDAAKMRGNPNLAIYSKLVNDIGEDFAIQTLPLLAQEGYCIPLGVDISESQAITFSAKEEGLKYSKIILEDRIMKRFINLLEDEYTVNISLSGYGRFFLHLGNITDILESQRQEQPVSVFFSGGNMIVSSHMTQDAVCLLLNASGQIIHSFQLEAAKSIKIDASAGLYILSVETKTDQYSLKVIKAQ